MASVKARARKSTKAPLVSVQRLIKPDTVPSKVHANIADVSVQEPVKVVPVSCVPGAMWGYCPRCSAPSIHRAKPVGDVWGKDRCMTGHEYPSMDAMPRPLVAVPPPAYKAKLIRKRR